jgi:sugar phosphate isomerase/epimerase
LHSVKISFSTLACPDWTLKQAVELAVRNGYDGLELRFLEGEDSLWKLSAFQGRELQRSRGLIADSGLAIACLDTSCRFDSPEALERKRWIDEGVRMAELAAQLGAPAIRVFGDRIQPGANREQTVTLISDSLNMLVENLRGSELEVWLETHGDFASAADVEAVLSACPVVQIIWDPACAIIERGERPLESGLALQRWIRHAHIKDLSNENGSWTPVLTGDGTIPLSEIRTVFETIGYTGYLSFEWEKKWHPSIEAAEIAVPHFANWFRSQGSFLGPAHNLDVVQGGKR